MIATKFGHRPERAPARTADTAPMPPGGATPWRRLRGLTLQSLLSAVGADASVADHSCAAEFSAPHRARPGAPVGVARRFERETVAALHGMPRPFLRAWRRVLTLAALSLGVLAAACLTATSWCWPRRRRASTGACAGEASVRRMRHVGRISLALFLICVDATAATVRSLARPARARPRGSRVAPHHSRARGHAPPVRAYVPYRPVSPARAGRLHEPRRAARGPEGVVRRLGRDDRAPRADEAVGRLGGDGHEQTHLRPTVQRHLQRGTRRPRRATGAQRTHHSTRAPPHPVPDAHSGFRARFDREG